MPYILKIAEKDALGKAKFKNAHEVKRIAVGADIRLIFPTTSFQM